MWLIASLTVALTAQAARIPFETGVTLTYAAAITGKPDWESRISVVSRESGSAQIASSWSITAKDGTVRWYTVPRALPDDDRQGARSFHVYVNTKDTRNYRGSSFHMPSHAVLADLKRNGRAPVEFLAPEIAPLPYTGTLMRTGSESLKVLVNGHLTTLPGVRAQGTLTNPSSPQPATHFAFVFLDDSVAPWIMLAEVRNAAGTGRRQLVQIRYRVRPSAVEAELAAHCRATEYGIYFASGSADLDSASGPALAAIAQAMKDHPTWPLRIVGHTDSIGTAAANLELAQRRAERVRLTLIGSYGVAATRLRAEGKGEGSPLADNGSLAGRARNRRVELIRNCG